MSFVLHTKKSTQTDFSTAYSKKHVICTAHSKKHLKSRQKRRQKRRQKKTAKELAKNMPKKYIAIYTTHMANHQKKTLLKAYSSTCLAAVLKPVLNRSC